LPIGQHDRITQLPQAVGAIDGASFAGFGSAQILFAWWKTFECEAAGAIRAGGSPTPGRAFEGKRDNRLTNRFAALGIDNSTRDYSFSD
jgi:hypothetical protein